MVMKIIDGNILGLSVCAESTSCVDFAHAHTPRGLIMSETVSALERV